MVIFEVSFKFFYIFKTFILNWRLSQTGICSGKLSKIRQKAACHRVPYEQKMMAFSGRWEMQGFKRWEDLAEHCALRGSRTENERHVSWGGYNVQNLVKEDLCLPDIRRYRQFVLGNYRKLDIHSLQSFKFHILEWLLNTEQEFCLKPLQAVPMTQGHLPGDTLPCCKHIIPRVDCWKSPQNGCSPLHSDRGRWEDHSHSSLSWKYTRTNTHTQCGTDQDS